MFMSFAVKVPMWPVHTWLPDAHTEAPTGGSVVLAAITLKVGGYGFLRFNLPIAPDASHELAGFMITLSLIAVVYIGLVALVQADMKKLIAYSSISHMGFVTLGIFVFNADGMLGAMIQMVSHGFISAALFLCVGVLYDRVHSRQISDYGGVANTMPVFAAFFVLFAMANSGLPATSGFVGEFFVILGTMKVSFWYTFLAATTLIFGAAYTLWMVKRVVYGEVANEHVAPCRTWPPRAHLPRDPRRLRAARRRLSEAPHGRDEPVDPGAAAPRRAVQGGNVNTATFSLATLAPGDPGDPAPGAGLHAARRGPLPRRRGPRDDLLAHAPVARRRGAHHAGTIGLPTRVTFQGMFVADLMSQMLKVARSSPSRRRSSTAARTSRSAAC
jgi:hypothetical protein